MTTTPKPTSTKPTTTRKRTTKASTPKPFDISRFRMEKTYVWREIERDQEEPLRVRVLVLDGREVNAIPWGADTTLQEMFEGVAPSVMVARLSASVGSVMRGL